MGILMSPGGEYIYMLQIKESIYQYGLRILPNKIVCVYNASSVSPAQMYISYAKITG